MAVKGSATVTLTQYRDIQSVTRYYKLRPAGSSAPLKPETKPPSSDWTDSEPTCDISKELYFCDLTIFSNGQWEYSKVSKSSSYEAAKEAYNKAQNASNTASAAKDSIDNLEIGGRNLFRKEWYSVAPWNNAVRSETFINEECLYVDKGKLYNNTNNGTTTLFPNITFEENTQYVISVDYTEAENTLKGSLYFVFRYSDDSTQSIFMESKSWTRYMMISQAGKTVSAITMTYGTNSVNSYIKNLKLEKGNKATDWTPAPEDVDAGIANAQGTADSKRRVFYNTPTVPYDAGDLWVQGSGGDILRCAQAKTSTGSYNRNDWVLASKYTDDSALNTWIEGDFATTIQGLEDGIIDAKIETYYQATDPSTGWSDTQKSEHKGDLWYNSTASVQKYYRWSGTAWQELTATPPHAVFDSIDKKATIYTGTATPTNPSSGDL